MPFKQYVRAEIAAGLDETYQFEGWSDRFRGAGYYDVHVSVIEERETSVPTLRRVLRGSNLNILESGCGTGRWMAFFERLGHRAFGVDDSAGPLQEAKSHLASLRLVRADARVSPFKSASFDAAFSSYVAEHFEEGLDPLLQEIHRLLKPGGTLVLVVPYNSLFRRLFTHRLLQAFYVVSRWRTLPLEFTEYRYSRREVRQSLELRGFHIEHCEPDDFRLPWAKGLSVDLGHLVAPRGATPGAWELNRPALYFARGLRAISPWLCAAGVLYVARKAT